MAISWFFTIGHPPHPTPLYRLLRGAVVRSLTRSSGLTSCRWIYGAKNFVLVSTHIQPPRSIGVDRNSWAMNRGPRTWQRTQTYPRSPEMNKRKGPNLNRLFYVAGTFDRERIRSRLILNAWGRRSMYSSPVAMLTSPSSLCPSHQADSAKMGGPPGQ